MVARRARSEDAEAFAEVLAAVAEEGLIATEPPVDIKARAEEARARMLGTGPDGLWVLEDESRIVGALGLGSTTAEGVFELGMMVLRECRGRGGGRALLEAALELARASGAHKVELEVWPDNARAIALYASAGFEVEGVRRDHYRRRDGRLRSVLLMALLLTREEEGGESGPRTRGAQ
jgi:putative acetyltransferase